MVKFFYNKVKTYPMIKNAWDWNLQEEDFDISTNLTFNEIIEFFKSY